MSRQDSPPTTEHAEDEDARRLRIAAMRELAGTEMPPQETRRPPHRMRRLPMVLAALTVIVLLAVVGSAWQGWLPWQRGKPTTNGSMVSVNLAANNLYCPSAAVWSPDNQQIAILAQLGACTQFEVGIVEPTVVAILNTRGELIRLLYPDTVTLGNTAPTTPQPTPLSSGQPPSTVPSHVQYPTLAWSPDGKQIAISYFATFQHDQALPIEQVRTESGVALLPVDGTDGDRLSARYWSSDAILDLQTRTLMHPSTAPQPPALAYQWTSQGALAPVADAPPSGPVGNPSGGDRFTIWQPGSVSLDRQRDALDFGATFMAWSPDGRYLAPFVGFGGELAPGRTGVTRLSDGSYQLAPRDKGLLIAASQLKSPSNPNATFMPVAWRSDGRLIAVLEPNPLLDQITSHRYDGPVPSATEKVAIYDCATGAKRLTLTTKPLANRLQTAEITLPPVVRWSSSGQQVLLLDTSFDSFTIWDVSMR